MSFHVGQKVVCVDDSCRSAGTIVSCHDGRLIRITEREKYPLRTGAVYTIRELAFSHISGAPALKLEEIQNRPLGDDPFRASRFRPLVEDRKSVSFTIGADPDSDRWDNRKKRKEKV